MPAQDSDSYDDSPAPDSSGGGDSNDGGKTAMLNKDVLGGRDVGVGATISLKVVKDHGDQLEVQCCGDEKQPPEKEVAAPAGDGQMNSMLED